MQRWVLMVAIVCSCSSREDRAPKSEEPAAKGAVEPPPTPAEPAAAPAVDAAPPPATAADELPSFPGARLVTSAAVRSFTVGPESIYWCDRDVVHAAPKAGGGDLSELGTCAGASDVVPDGDSVYFCTDRGLVRVAGGSETVLATSSCLVPMVDDTHVYYVVPGFQGVPDPGVYRVAKAGGPAEKLYARTPREQYILALDSDALWIGTFGAGTISKLAKADGKLVKVVSGQKHLVDLAVDDQSVYWLIEDAAEVRRRRKRGGPIEVIGREVFQEPLVVAQGHAYWFEGGEGQGKRLVHLAPGAAEPAPIVDGLAAPWLEVDQDGVYLIQYGKPGIFAFPR